MRTDAHGLVQSSSSDLVGANPSKDTVTVLCVSAHIGAYMNENVFVMSLMYRIWVPVGL